MAMPTGVELHNGKIRIWFLYKGKRCREILKGWQVTNGNLKKAGQLRAKVTGDIQLGVFDYAVQFPESKAAKKFSSTLRISGFKELSDAYYQAKELEMSFASLRNLKSTLVTLNKLIGSNTQIADIQQLDILSYRRSLLMGSVVNEKRPHLNKTGRAPATVNEQIRVLCAMLRFAKVSQLITHSPFENIVSLRLSKKAPDPLSQEEFSLLMARLPKSVVNLWKVAIYTGMRHGELCALSWDDVDLEAGKIHVRRNLNNYDQFGPPKTSAGERIITLLQPAVDALAAQRELTFRDQATEITFHHREFSNTEQQVIKFVFRPMQRSADPNPYYSKNALRYSWQTGLKKAGIRPRVPYQSRHTYACWSLSAGAIPSFIASQMGHTDASMVYRVYSKWMSDKDVDQIKMLNEKLG